MTEHIIPLGRRLAPFRVKRISYTKSHGSEPIHVALAGDVATNSLDDGIGRMGSDQRDLVLGRCFCRLPAVS